MGSHQAAVMVRTIVWVCVCVCLGVSMCVFLHVLYARKSSFQHSMKVYRYFYYRKCGKGSPILKRMTCILIWVGARKTACTCFI